MQKTCSETCAYAVYFFDKQGNDEIVPELDDDNGTSKFNLITTTLQTEQEHHLRLFLVRRLKKGAIYVGTGNLSCMDFSLTDCPSSPAVSYYVLLPHDPGELIICLLASSEANLEVFRSELTDFCQHLASQLPQGAVEMLPAVVTSQLVTWPDECLQYVCRVLQAFGPEVTSLLQLALQHRTVSAEAGVNSGLQADVLRFLSACSVADCLSPPSGERAPGILLTSHRGARLEGVECNAYCKEWGRVLQEQGPTAEPWKVRRVIESFKLKTIKDMNVLKRLLKQSETNHYSFYRAYLFLWHSHNEDVLLSHARMEGGSTSDIVSVLEQQLAEAVQPQT